MEQYLVAAGAIVKNDKLLLGYKNRIKDKHAKWEVLGGRVKFGQSYDEALKAKMREYLGVEISVLKTLGFVHMVMTESIDGAPYQFFVIPTLCRAKSEDFVLSERIGEVGWFTLPDIEKMHVEKKMVNEENVRIARMILGKEQKEI